MKLSELALQYPSGRYGTNVFFFIFMTNERTFPLQKFGDHCDLILDVMKLSEITNEKF